MSFGLDYNRPLSFSRKTTMAFSTGTAGTYDRSLDETSYFLIGSVRLDREIGKTWSAGLVYGRNLRYIESLGGIPLLADTGTFVLQGSFSRRLQFKGRLGASSGNLVGEGSDGSSAGSTKTETYFGAAQLSMALTRQLALSADYAYYQYTLPEALLQTGGPGKNNYQSVRVQLQVFVPLMTRTKTGG